jgi:gliding motility-associated-like protein
MRNSVLTVIFILLSFVAFPQKRIVTPKVHPGLRFTENKGQLPDNVNYVVRMCNGNIYLEKNKLTYFLYDGVKYASFHMGGMGMYPDANVKGHAYEVEFVNCRNNINTISTDQLPYYENFFLGPDPSKWKSNVLNYKRVVYPNIYQDVDFEFLTDDHHLKYNFYVKPGTDYKVIKLKYNGARSVKLKDGNLIVETSIGTVVEEKPFAYQVVNSQTVQVPCVYKLSGDEISFEVGAYDIRSELIIDPSLVFAAQSGSTADNFGMTATYDAQGDLYTGGTVFDLGYPVTLGAYSNVFNGPVSGGNTDVVITKYKPAGNGILYSTYLGGTGSEVVGSLIVNESGELYLYGATGSSNFPMPGTPYDASFNGGTNLSFVFNGTTFSNGTDIYLCKFNSLGTALLASTYLGGSENDGVNYTNALVNYNAVFTTACPALTVSNFNLTEHKPDSLQHNYGDQYRGEIQLDKLGNVYIASSSRSSNFPTQNGFDNTLGGKQDAVVCKLDPNLSTLIWSSYLGGSENDAGYSLITTDSLFTYVTGGTISGDFPVKPGCYSTTYNGGVADGYIVKINAAGNAIVKGTFIGTNNYDQSYFVQKDKNNNIYVYGQSQGNMPVVGAVYSNPNSHQFISRLDCQLNSLNRSTVIGSGQSSIDISPSAFSVDNCGNIYISGWGGNITNTLLLNGMPTTANAIYTTPPNGYDFYLMALSSNMSSLVYGTYFGGNCSEEHVDGGTSRFDPTGKIYQSVCAGCGGNDDFPVSAGAWPCGYITACPPGPNLCVSPQPNCNNGVFKIDFNLNILVSSISSNTIQGCAPLAVTFTNVYSTSASTFTWYFGNGATNSTVTNPVYTYTAPGIYTVSLVIKDPTTCNGKDSSTTYITVLPTPSPTFSALFSPCGSTVATVNNTTISPVTYTWNWGDASPADNSTSPTHSYSASGVYTISLLASTNGCTNIATRTVSIFYFNPVVTPGLICEGGSTNLNASGGTSYTWNPGTGLSNSLIANPSASPSVTTVYTVTILNSGGPCSSDVTTTLMVNPKPTASFNYSINPCGGGVYFYDASTASITAWNWNINPLPVVTSTLQNPYYFYQSGGTFTVSLISTNQFGCTDTTAQVLVVPVPPPISINSPSTICKGNNAQLIASGGANATYSWTPPPTLSATNIANPVANPTVSTNYSVIITTSTGCQFLMITDVYVNYLSNTPISATATPTRVVQGSTTQLVYYGDPGSVISWNPGTFVNPKTGYTVTATPDRSTTYTVIAFNGACRETLYVYVEVVLKGCEEGDSFVPNTFTPNGDGQNDILYVRGLKVEELYFAVYNRWGEMVFETTDKTKGWDGIYKGRAADVGVFGYYLKVKCYDGNETFKKGNVTLIR